MSIMTYLYVYCVFVCAIIGNAIDAVMKIWIPFLILSGIQTSVSIWVSFAHTTQDTQTVRENYYVKATENEIISYWFSQSQKRIVVFTFIFLRGILRHNDKELWKSFRFCSHFRQCRLENTHKHSMYDVSALKAQVLRQFFLFLLLLLRLSFFFFSCFHSRRHLSASFLLSERLLFGGCTKVYGNAIRFSVDIVTVIVAVVFVIIFVAVAAHSISTPIVPFHRKIEWSILSHIWIWNCGCGYVVIRWHRL